MADKQEKQPSQIGETAKGVASDVAEKGVKKVGKKLLKKYAGKAVAKAVAAKVAAKVAIQAATKAIGAAIGSVIPGGGTAIGALIGQLVGMVLGYAYRAGKFLVKNGALAGAGVIVAGAAAGSNAAIAIGALIVLLPLILSILPGMALQFAIIIISLPIVVTIIIFIINTGAWVMPAWEGNSPGLGLIDPINPGTLANGTCPLTGDYDISTPSYNPPPETPTNIAGHGSNAYWSRNGITTSAQCANTWSIPIKSMYAGCYGPDTILVPNASGNICADNPIGSCEYYGYAVDVYPTSYTYEPRAVVIPKLCDNHATSCLPMTWSLVGQWLNCSGASHDPDDVAYTRDTCIAAGLNPWGYGYVFNADDNGHTWKLHLSHVDPIPSLASGSRTSFVTGEQIGYATADLDDPDNGYITHIHIELNIDEVPVKPDFMCGGYVEESSDGWAMIVEDSNDLVASKWDSTDERGEFVHRTCSWAENASDLGLDGFAVNANFFNTHASAPFPYAPVGPAGYVDDSGDGEITEGDVQRDSDGDEVDDPMRLLSLAIDNDGTRQFMLPENIFIPNKKLIITGIDIDDPGLSDRRIPRTGVGHGSVGIVFVVLPAATPEELKQTIIDHGGDWRQILLDGSDSTQLCIGNGSGYTQVFPAGTPNIISHSVGAKDATIINLGEEVPTPTPIPPNLPE